jgi:hypothetical protein
MIREAHYKFRKAIVDFVKEHLPCSRNRGLDVNIEISGCDEFYMDLTYLVDELVKIQAYHDIDSNRNVIIEGEKGVTIFGIS